MYSTDDYKCAGGVQGDSGPVPACPPSWEQSKNTEYVNR